MKQSHPIGHRFAIILLNLLAKVTILKAVYSSLFTDCLAGWHAIDRNSPVDRYAVRQILLDTLAPINIYLLVKVIP